MGNTTQTRTAVRFNGELPPGTKVWLSAFWCNPRLQSGPPCNPVSTNIAGGLAATA